MGQYFNKFKTELKQILTQIGNLSLLKTNYKTDLVGAINEVQENVDNKIGDTVFSVGFQSNIFKTVGFNQIPINSSAWAGLNVSPGVFNQLNQNVFDISAVSMRSLIKCSLALSSSRTFTTIARMYPLKSNLAIYDDFEFSSSSFLISRMSAKSGGFAGYEAVSFGVQIFDSETTVKLSQIILSTQNYSKWKP